MLTLGSLIASSDITKLYSTSYKLELFRKTQEHAENGNFLQFLGVIAGDQKARKCSIKVYSATVTETSPVVVYCSCEMFRNKYETLLASRGSAKSLHTGNKLPTKANPTFKIGLCPHLLFLAKAAVASNSEAAKAKNVKGYSVSNKLKRNR